MSCILHGTRLTAAMSDHPSSSSTSKSGAPTEGTTGKKYVRVITEKRREQNRRSQKAYRERLKKRLEGLEELEEKIKAKDPQEEHSRANAPPPEAQGLENEQDQIADFTFDDVASAYPAIIDLGDAFHVSGDLSLPGGSSLPLVDIAIRTHSSSPPDFSPALATTTSTPPLPTVQDIDLFPFAADPDFPIAWPAPTVPRSSPTNQSPHSTTLSDQLLPFSPASSAAHYAASWPGFSPQANHLRLQGFNFLTAQMTVAASLGISRESYHAGKC